MNYPYKIIYKNIRNAYARVNRDGIVVFTIPQRLQENEKFISDFLKRWETLYIKYSKRSKVQSYSNNGVMLFWEDVERIDIFPNGKDYSIATKNKKLREILLEYSIERINRFSNQLWINRNIFVFNFSNHIIIFNNNCSGSISKPVVATDKTTIIASHSYLIRQKS